MQHGNRHRHFEPPHDMEPGAPETLEALDAARGADIARWAWEQRPEVFQIHQHIATHTPEDVARWVLDWRRVVSDGTARGRQDDRWWWSRGVQVLLRRRGGYEAIPSRPGGARLDYARPLPPRV